MGSKITFHSVAEGISFQAMQCGLGAKGIRIESRRPGLPCQVEVGLEGDQEGLFLSLDAISMKNVRMTDSLFCSLMRSAPATIELKESLLAAGQPDMLATSLKTNGKIRVLSLVGTKISSEESIALLQALKEGRVEELYLEGASLDNRVLNVLAEFLKRNEHLKKLSFSPGLREEGANWPANFADALKNNRTIEEIVITEPHIEKRGLKATRFCLHKEDVDTLLDGLKGNLSITKMDVGPSSQRGFHSLFSNEAWSYRWWKKEHEWNRCFERNKEERWTKTWREELPQGNTLDGDAASSGVETNFHQAHAAFTAASVAYLEGNSLYNSLIAAAGSEE